MLVIDCCFIVDEYKEDSTIRSSLVKDNVRILVSDNEVEEVIAELEPGKG